MASNAGEQVFERLFPSMLGVYHGFIDEVLEALRGAQWGEHDLFGVHMALEEAISNAIRHGNKGNPDKQVKVECRFSAERFWARICDEGKGYCRRAVPDCRNSDRLEAPGGRGLALIEAYMDSVEYNDKGNCLTIHKDRGPADSEQSA